MDPGKNTKENVSQIRAESKIQAPPYKWYTEVINQTLMNFFFCMATVAANHENDK